MVVQATLQADAPAVIQPDQRPKAKPLPSLDTIKGVLFDIDGTLVESDPLHFAAFREILLEVGYKGYNNGEPITMEWYNRVISGRHNPDIARDLFPQWTLAQQEAFSDDKEARFRRLAQGEMRPIEGLPEFLEWLDRRGLRKAAVTNAPRENTKTMLGGLKLDNYFEDVILGEECTRAKPFPDPYLRGLKVLGLKPEETIIIEDSPSGIAAGVAAGIPVVGITSGHPRERLLAAGATTTISNYNDLLALIPEAAR